MNDIDRQHAWVYGGRIVRFYCHTCHKTHDIPEHEYGQLNGYELSARLPQGPCMPELEIKQLAQVGDGS